MQTKLRVNMNEPINHRRQEKEKAKQQADKFKNKRVERRSGSWLDEMGGNDPFRLLLFPGAVGYQANGRRRLSVQRWLALTGPGAYDLRGYFLCLAGH